MQMPRPSPEQQALSIMAGDWLGKEQVQPSPFDIAGGTAIGHVHNCLGLDGFIIVHDYVQERNGKVSLCAHAIVQWDTLAKQAVMYWFDSFGMPPTTFRGMLKDNILTLITPQGTGFSRITYDFSKPGSYTYRMEVSIDGTEWYPFTSGDYTRQ